MHHEQGLQLQQQGNHTLALEHFQKALDVTPEMAYQLIKVS